MLQSPSYIAYLTLILPAILTFLSTTFAGWIRQDGFNVWVNRLLAAIAILAAAVLSALVNGKLTGNFSTDYLSIQSAIALLVGGILAPLGKEFQSNWFAFLPAKTSTVAAVAHRAQLPAISPSALPTQNTAPTGVIPAANPNSSRTTRATGWQPTVQSWNTNNAPQQQDSSDHSG